MFQLHVAREISVYVSYTSGTSVNQGLQAALDGTLLNRAWYRNGMLPRGLWSFRPKLVRDAVDAVSQGATYPRDGPFPGREDLLREARPRDCEGRAGELESESESVVSWCRPPLVRTR